MFASTASMEISLPELAAVLIVSAMGILLIACMLLQARRAGRSDAARGSIDRPGMKSAITSAIELEQRLIELQCMIELKTAEIEQLLARAEHVMLAIQASAIVDSGSPPAGSISNGGQHATIEPRQSPAVPIAVEPSANRFGAIYRLADGGLTPSQIAARLREHVGRIELILALRQ